MSDEEEWVHCGCGCGGYARRREPSQTSTVVDETPDEKQMATDAQQRTVPTTPEQP